MTTSNGVESNSEGRRQLRSFDYQTPSLSFIFDNDYKCVDYSKPLRLIFGKITGPSLNSLREETKTRDGSDKRVFDLAARPVTKGAKSDALSDDKYSAYIKRKEREEKRLLNVEREHGVVELERMQDQLDQLLSARWREYISSIVNITDHGDMEELEIKRLWCIDEIEMYMHRYREWKRKFVELRKAKGPAASPASDSTTRIPARKQLASSRRPFISFFKSPSRRIKFQQLLSRKTRTDAWAFGSGIPAMSRRYFDIPDSWKKRESP